MSKKLNRVGEIYKTSTSGNLKIIEYFGTENCTVLFETGEIIRNIAFGNIKRGRVQNLKVDRTGEVYTNSIGQQAIIIKYDGVKKCTIRFEDGTVVHNKVAMDLIKGEFRNPNHPTIYGKGYLGQGKYSTVTHPKIKSRWKSMFDRCYDKRISKKAPSYTEATVCENWWCFQNFAEWCEDKYNPETMQGWCLDKDIRVKGNKVYSPETCCFVPQEINGLFIRMSGGNRKLPIGVYSVSGKFKGLLSNTEEGDKSELFDTIEEAFEYYKFHKELRIKKIADKWRHLITLEVYQAMYNYEIEITD